MPAIPRKTQALFGGNVPASGNIAQFGSKQAGTPVYSNDPAVIQALAAFGNGWSSAIFNGQSPYLQDMNALFYLLTYQLSYLLQSGLPEYDADTTYYLNQFCRVAGKTYVSLQDSNLGNTPAPGSAYWKPYSEVLAPDMPGVAKAWVVFDGRTGTVLNSYNVDGVTRTAAGTYTIAFTSGTFSAEYAFSGSCGTVHGGTGLSGDNNVVVGTNIRNYEQCGVKCWDAGPQTAEDSDRVSVIFFSR